MDENFEKSTILENIDVPADLLNKVMLRLDKERKLQALRQRLILVAASFLPLLAIAVPVWRSFQLDIIQSGFGEYMSLILYDFKIVLANWQDFGLILLESLPVISTVAMLTLLLGWLLALKFAVKYGKAFFNLLTWRAN